MDNLGILLISFVREREWKKLFSIIWRYTDYIYNISLKYYTSNIIYKLIQSVYKETKDMNYDFYYSLYSIEYNIAVLQNHLSYLLSLIWDLKNGVPLDCSSIQRIKDTIFDAIKHAEFTLNAIEHILNYYMNIIGQQRNTIERIRKDVITIYDILRNLESIFLDIDRTSSKEYRDTILIYKRPEEVISGD